MKKKCLTHFSLPCGNARARASERAGSALLCYFLPLLRGRSQTTDTVRQSQGYFGGFGGGGSLNQRSIFIKSKQQTGLLPHAQCPVVFYCLTVAVVSIDCLFFSLIVCQFLLPPSSRRMITLIVCLCFHMLCPSCPLCVFFVFWAGGLLLKMSLWLKSNQIKFIYAA